MAACLKGERDGVLHLHGHWDDAPSVVFSKRDYERLQQWPQAQFLQQLATHNFTLLFVGCGTSGLADQNVGKLLSWFQQHWSGLAARHFALVRDDEQGANWPQAVTPVVYGAKHEHLAPFIVTLVPAAVLVTDRPFPAEPNMVGRVDAKQALVDMILNGKRPVLVLGGPGMGKSTLAVAAAHDVAVKARYGNRRIFVNLEPHTTADALVRACAAAFGVAATGSLTEILRRLQETMRQPHLVILDNLETPWYAQRSETETWIGQLKDLESLRLILTHRGEKPSIPGGAEQLDDVTRLPLEDARALFLRDLPDRFAKDPDLGALLRELDGHPLSIVLLAVQADGRPNLKSLLADWLEKKAELLQIGQGDTRLLSTRTSLAISIKRLDKKSRRLFGLVAFVPDGLAEVDVGSILPGAGTTECIILERMRLVTRDQGRLRMLAPFREATQLDDPPSRPDERRLINHFLTIARTGKSAGSSSWQGLAGSIQREAENLDATINHAVDRKDFPPERLSDAARGLMQYHLFSGRGAITSAARVVKQLASSSEARLQAICLEKIGDVMRFRADSDGARQRYDEAMRLFQKLGNENGRANCMQGLADIALRRSDYDDARQRFEEALHLFQKLGAELGPANCMLGLGEIALRRSDLDRAWQYFQKAMPLFQKASSELGRANCIAGLGDIAYRRSDLDGARQYFEKAMPHFQKVGSERGWANSTVSLGNIALRRSDFDDALQCYEEAMRLFQKLGDETGRANCIHRFGDLALRKKADATGAVAYWNIALDLYVRLGDKRAEAFTCVKLARHGSPNDARRRRDQARIAFQAIGLPDFIKRFVDGNEDTDSEF